MTKNKIKFKPVEMELCRVTDEDEDVFIVYKDYTAIYEMHSDEQEVANWITWKLKPDEDGHMAFYYILIKNGVSTAKEQTDFDVENDFERRLVEAIQMALLGEEIEEVISEKEEE